MIPEIRILIVDDDLRIANLHQRFVEKLEHFETVDIANRIVDAMEMVEILQPDVVLLDLFFPEGNGMELLFHIRSRKQPCDIILITAAREIASLQEALRGGVFDYIIKPVSFPRFQESLLNYHTYFQHLQSGNLLDQQDVDRFLHIQHTPDPSSGTMPKGIDPLTLSKVRKVFDDSALTDINAEEMGRAIGTSRSTARRYLEFLVAEGFLKADLIYGAVGRPERRYLRR